MRKNLKRLAMTAALCIMGAALCGCGTKEPEGTATDTAYEEENYETGDASLDNPRNQDEIGDNELLVVSFGTSFNDSRRLTIGAIEAKMEESFSEYSVRRGFTSQIIIDHVKERDGEVIDNVKEALDRAVANNVKTLVVQPTHIMDGYEYNELVDEVANYSDAFEKVAIGKPLLSEDEDYDVVIRAVTEATSQYDDGETAICLMGHGTSADSNSVYTKLQDKLTAAEYENYFIGTVEAKPGLEDVLASVKKGNYKKVVLQPLMIVAGDHANNDMAGDEEDSWKSAFEAEGYTVECLLKGLGELPDIQELFVKHAQDAIESIKTSEESTTENAGTVEAIEVVEDDMVPVYAECIEDGVYDVVVDSSSSMFNIVSCRLMVENGKMEAEMTMGGTGYLYLYMGTAEEAAAAGESDYIPFNELDSGEHSFRVPVEALDSGIDCAAYSKKKEKWYDRVILFRADSLPSDAYTVSDRKEVADLGLEEGEYTVSVKLSGGSGKAKITSPAKLIIKEDKATAVIEWGSPNYDYMVVDGEKYLPVNTEGNSTFEIPVAAFDCKLNVSADTTAMSTPHEIDYVLYFDSSTIK